MNSQKKPLLYIHQPRMNEVKSSMQDVFRGSSKVTQPKKERIIPQQIETKRRTELYEAAPLGSLKQAEYHPVRKIEKDAVDPIRKKESLGIEPSREDNSASKETRQHQGQLGKDPSYDGYFKPLTPFKDLDLDGKIEYMEQSIMGRSPFPCAFQTDEAVYRGVLLKADGASIDIKTFQGDEVTLSRNSLKAIQIIGLK